jgi:2-dehydropantoate 2-reductase
VAVHRPHRPTKCFRDSIGPVGAAPRYFHPTTAASSWWRGEGTEDVAQGSERTPRNGRPTLDLPEEEQREDLPTRRVHLMGMGSIGTFVAHTLMCLPNPPPISLMFHRPEMHDAFKAGSRIIRLINRRSQTNDERSGYDIDLAEYDGDKGTVFWRHMSNPPSDEKEATPPGPEEILPSGEVRIYTLIVTVKGPATVAAVRSVKHRISAQTTICLMQNGIGQVDELNREVFTDPETRPTYMLGVVSHGVYLSTQFAAIHAGIGSTAIGIVRDLDKFPPPPKSPLHSPAGADQKQMFPTDKDLYSNITSRYLLRTLTRSPILVCAAFPYLDLLQLQLEKLAVNCIINPITALLNVPNGSLLYNFAVMKVARLLIAEISVVIRSLPELDGVPNVRDRFSPERLETLFRGITKKTTKNSSSMREDIRKGKETEIDYLNGYIVRRGEERGIKCVLNYMLMQLVKGKSWNTADADGQSIPYGVSEVLGSPNQHRAEDSQVILEDRGTAQRDEPGRLEEIKADPRLD